MKIPELLPSISAASSSEADVKEKNMPTAPARDATVVDCVRCFMVALPGSKVDFYFSHFKNMVMVIETVAPHVLLRARTGRVSGLEGAH